MASEIMTVKFVTPHYLHPYGQFMPGHLANLPRAIAERLLKKRIVRPWLEDQDGQPEPGHA